MHVVVVGEKETTTLPGHLAVCELVFMFEIHAAAQPDGWFLLRESMSCVHWEEMETNVYTHQRCILNIKPYPPLSWEKWRQMFTHKRCILNVKPYSALSGGAASNARPSANRRRVSECTECRPPGPGARAAPRRL